MRAAAAGLATTRNVSSPAIVPTISGCSTRSSARAIAGAAPISDLITTRFWAAVTQEAELLQDRVARGRRVGAPAARDRVPGPPELVVELLDPELAEIPRESVALSDCATRGGQRLPQFQLGADAAPADHALDQALALVLRERTGVGMHPGA